MSCPSMFKPIVIFMLIIVELLAKCRVIATDCPWVAVGTLSMVAWRIVDSGVDLSWVVTVIPLGSWPKMKKTSFFAPSSPPEVMDAVNAPLGCIVIRAEAKSLLGNGGLTRMYA